MRANLPNVRNQGSLAIAPALTFHLSLFSPSVRFFSSLEFVKIQGVEADALWLPRTKDAPRD